MWEIMNYSGGEVERYELLPIIERLDRIEAKLYNIHTDKWMDTKQVCDYTTLSASSIHRGVAMGTLKVSKTTGKNLFKQSWVDRWLTNK